MTRVAATKIREPGRARLDVTLSTHPNEACLVLYLFVLPLNTESLAFPAFTMIKIALGVLAAFTAVISVMQGPQPRGAHAWERFGLVGWSAYLYVGVLVAASLRSLPLRRHELLIQFLIGTVALIVAERCRRGSALRILLTVSVGHLVLASLLGKRAPSTVGIERLTGASHAITLGFESGILLLWALSCLGRRHRHTGWLGLLIALAGYTLFASFSRTALIGTAVAVLVLWALRSRAPTVAGTVVRLLVGSLGVVAMLLLFGGRLLSYLQGRDTSDFSTASGRTAIWSNVWAYRNEYLVHGFGFGVLQSADGPDVDLYRATTGLPMEDSFLNALVMAGILGALLFSLLLLGVLMRSLMAARRHKAEFPACAAVLLLVFAVFSEDPSGPGIEWYWLLVIWTLVCRTPDLRGRSPGP